MTHQTDIELALCWRDYDLLEQYHTGLLTRIEQAVKSGVTPQQIRRWAKNVTNEAELLQRVYNAARWLASEQPAPDPADWQAANRMVTR